MRRATVLRSVPRLRSSSTVPSCYSCGGTEHSSRGRDKQMYGHRRSDLASRRGELSATTSKRGVLVVITKGQSSANYTAVVHLADKRGNNSLFNSTSSQSRCLVLNA